MSDGIGLLGSNGSQPGKPGLNKQWQDFMEDMQKRQQNLATAAVKQKRPADASDSKRSAKKAKTKGKKDAADEEDEDEEEPEPWPEPNDLVEAQDVLFKRAIRVKHSVPLFRHFDSVASLFPFLPFYPGLLAFQAQEVQPPSWQVRCRKDQLLVQILRAHTQSKRTQEGVRG